ncbi:MAG: Pr6Pr family membrane protein [Methyloceanibacter sp.]
MAKYYRIGAAAVAWFALVLQYTLTVTKPGAPFLEATVRYFSFFTIITNVLVALALTLPWLAPESRAGQFFDRPSVRTAILAYIIIVAVIYHYLLAKLWNPQGWQLIADTIEHVVTPALYVIDWVLFVPKGTVKWKSAVVWLGYPLVYAAYSLIHGAVTGFYPYPFINVSNLGYDKVLINMAVLVLVFLGLGLALIGIDRRMGRSNEQAAGAAT